MEKKVNAKVVRPPAWTEDVPVTDGYYWVQESGDGGNIKIVRAAAGKVVAFGGRLEFFLDRQKWMTDEDWKTCCKNNRYMWAGPIEPPT